MVMFMLLVTVMLGSILPVASASAELASHDAAEGADHKPTGTHNRLVYVIPIEQTIESGLQRFLERSFAEAEKHHASHIILRINTLGGSVEAAMGIGELIRLSPIPTIAFIEGKAISAGSYIALNANEIAMAKGSTIGAAAVVDISGNRVEDSKIVATWVGEMESAALLNGRNTLYAAGMVDDRLNVEVKEIGETFGPGELIVFNYEQALAAGYAEVLASNINEIIDHIGIEQPEIVEIKPSFAERLARILTNPFVMPLLLLIGLGGIVIELFAPGFGAPGIIGIASFALYFFGNYVAGFAGVEHIVLFVLGIVLLLIEIFVPSFGILGVSGILSLFAGIILAAYDREKAMYSLGIAIIIAIILVAVIAKYFKHRGVWNRFILKEEFKTEAGYVSSSSKEHLLGKQGIALTTLRPSGTALIEDQRVDVVTSGQFIKANQPIEVVQVEGTRVVVREIIK